MYYFVPLFTNISDRRLSCDIINRRNEKINKIVLGDTCIYISTTSHVQYTKMHERLKSTDISKEWSETWLLHATYAEMLTTNIVPVQP